MKLKKRFQVLSALLLLGFCLYVPLHVNATSIVEAGSGEKFGAELARLCSQYAKVARISSEENAPIDKEYECRRLIVKSNGGDLSLTDFSAIEILKGPDNLYVMQFGDSVSTREAAQKLEKQANVAYVEADKKISTPEVKVTKASAEKLYGVWSWGVDYMGISSYASQVKKCVGSTTIKIAVVDSGIYPHSAFSSHLIKGTNYVFEEEDRGTVDLNGHGTHVTGIIYDCLRGFNVKIMPLKALNKNGEGYSGSMGWAIREAADKGAKVINLSANLNGDDDEFLHDCIKYAVKKKNAVVVNSAGNGRKGISENVKNSCPADVESAIVVGAIDDLGIIASFSNTGSTVDVVAPGVDVRSTYLQNGMTMLSGTSMAAPHVAGLATLIRLANPSYSAEKVESVIKDYARDLGIAGKDDVYGYGMPYVGNIKLNPVTKVTLNKTSQTLKVTEQSTLKATLTPSTSTLKTVKWSSSNSSVAAVTSDGLVIARGKGTATITAKAVNGKTATCKVTVTAANKLPREQFSLNTYNSSTKTAEIKTKKYNDATGFEVELQNTAKKILETKFATSSVKFTKLSNQKVYYYRARAYYDISNYRVYGAWSDRRMFSTSYATVKVVSSKKSVKITTPKVTGVKQFEVWIASTDKAESYKKIKTLSPGKSYTLSTLRGKKLTSYGKNHKFYVMLKPVYSITGQKDEMFVKKNFVLK